MKKHHQPIHNQTEQETGLQRREFLHASAFGLLAFAQPLSFLSAMTKESAMGVIVHSYSIRWNAKTESKTYPAFTDAIQLLEHCHELGAGGIQVTLNNWTTDFAKKVRDRREKLGLYLEGSIGLPKTSEDVATFEKEVLAAKEAGAQVLRTVCLNGRRYENFNSAEAFATFKKQSIQSLQWAEPIVKKHRIKLAVENHKDWKAAELLEILKGIASPWVGVTLDFGNNISLVGRPHGSDQSPGALCFFDARKRCRISGIRARFFNVGGTPGYWNHRFARGFGFVQKDESRHQFQPGNDHSGSAANSLFQ